MIGRKISHYEIVEKIGEGGMGVVYKAKDTKLQRILALKFLAPQAFRGEEQRTRFLREAQAAAAISHPNICTIYEIDEAGEQTFLAMEFIEGRSLKDWIESGPLKLTELLDVAYDAACGLRAAHEKGVVHRDIKSANIMVSDRGQVKVMDFGLAHFEARTTVTPVGSVMGTAAYMSPEQAQGEPVDGRSDVWSLGVVVYEMVTGQLPFKGAYEQVVVYSILNEDPVPMTALRAALPLELEWIVGKALAKDPAERYQHVEEMIVDIGTLRRKLSSGKSKTAAVQSAPPRPKDTAQLRTRPSLRQVAPWILLVSAVALIVWQSLRSPQPVQQDLVQKFAFTTWNNAQNPVISPNGRHIGYVAGEGQQSLWIQDLDREQPRKIKGTEGALWPFWSPGSDFVGLVIGGELKKVSVDGGPVVNICQLPGARFAGGVWSPGGDSIVFSSLGPSDPQRLYEVPGRGGQADLLIEPESSEKRLGFATPHFLPLEGDRRILLFALGTVGETQLVLADPGGDRREVLASGVSPVYSPSGHIVYQTSPLTDGLWALPFSLDSLKPVGEPFPLPYRGRQPSVSANGTLVYLGGAWEGKEQLVWLDRSGTRQAVIGQPQQEISSPVLSPDRRRVAVRSLENQNRDIWIHEIDRPVKTRLTHDEESEGHPTWSPSGDDLAFSSIRGGNRDIYMKPADGSGESRAVVKSALPETPLDWSTDTGYLLYEQRNPETGTDLWYLRRRDNNGGYEPVAFLKTPFNEQAGKFSPDGHFVVYLSDESGRNEVCVRPFPEGRRRWQVSYNGGAQPRWSRDGKELFYVEGETLVAVAVTTEPDFSLGSPTRLFSSTALRGVSRPRYDVSADGKRFVVSEALGEKAPRVIRVVQNWFAEFPNRRAGQP